MQSLIDVYPYRLASAPEYLVMKRAKGKRYAGQWRMVAGKVEGCETAWQGGLRELREETGVFPVKYWSVPSVNTFYETATDTIHHIPAFAAQVEAQCAIVLNDEHNEWRWIPAADVKTYLVWPEQQRLVRLIDDILKTQKIIQEWKIPL